MERQFVTYEIALKLKELGFDEECFAHYQNSKTIIPKCAILKSSGQLYYKQNNINPANQYGDEFCTAPLWQQAIDWLFDKHGLYLMITVNPYSEINLFNGYKIYSDDEDLKCIVNQETQCWSYYKAREQAILKAIELI